MKQFIFGIFVILILLAPTDYALSQKNTKNPEGPPPIIIFRTNENESNKKALEGKRLGKKREGSIKSYGKNEKELIIQFDNKNDPEKFKINNDATGEFKEGDSVTIEPLKEKGQYKMYRK